MLIIIGISYYKDVTVILVGRRPRMKEPNQLLKPLTEQLMKEVMLYGILEVSTGQYRCVCSSILRFAESAGHNTYSDELMESYMEHISKRVSDKDICPEFHRFQYRVVRMLSSLVNTGQVDFSSTRSRPRKYIVPEDISIMVDKILDDYPISKATKKDLLAPTRHFLWYAMKNGISPELMDDALIMDFLINEVPVSNRGSTGRTLRCVKYATEYLKKRGNTRIRRDYTLLKLKNDHRRIIPAYSEEEICGIAESSDTDDALGKRDHAIILLAYCTGLRGVDIIGIRFSDIDWRNSRISVVQSKTHSPIVSELNGTTMNALADYILEWRPRCDIPEIFVTVKAPYRKLSNGFGSMIDKYCKKAGVEKVSFRGFHSIRRSFETVMVSRGVPIETASQMMGHKTITEDKPYITHNKDQISFVAMDFSDVPISAGFYYEGNGSSPSNEGGVLT